MATNTPNIGVTKPAGIENYSLAVWNANSDIIDAEITDAKAGSNVRIFKCANDTTSVDNALNVQAGDGRYYIRSLVYTKTEANALNTTQNTAIALNTAKNTNVSTNLGYTASTSNGLVTSSDGTNATIPLVVASGNAGLMTGADKTKLNGIQTSATTLPTGAMIDFAGTVAPTGFLVCNGGVLSTTTYAGLYAVIGNVWANTGGASTPVAGTFRIPPSAIGGLGVFSRGVGAVGVGTYQADLYKSHTHVGGAHTHVGGLHAHTGANHTHTANHAHTASSNSTGGHYHNTGGGLASVTSNYWGSDNFVDKTTYRSDYLSTVNAILPRTNTEADHAHTITINTTSVTTSSAGALATSSGGNVATSSAGAVNTGASGATETIPRSITVLKCIKY